MMASTSPFRATSRIICITLMTLLQSAHACFSLNDGIVKTCLWTPSDKSNLVYNICNNKDHNNSYHGNRSHTDESQILIIDTEREDSEKIVSLTCEKAYTHEKDASWTYLVRISNSSEKIGYRCIRFAPLAPRVVRVWRTVTAEEILELDCNTAKYLADPGVLMPARSMPSNIHDHIDHYIKHHRRRHHKHRHRNPHQKNQDRKDHRNRHKDQDRKDHYRHQKHKDRKDHKHHHRNQNRKDHKHNKKDHHFKDRPHFHQRPLNKHNDGNVPTFKCPLQGSFQIFSDSSSLEVPRRIHFQCSGGEDSHSFAVVDVEYIKHDVIITKRVRCVGFWLEGTHGTYTKDDGYNFLSVSNSLLMEVESETLPPKLWCMHFQKMLTNPIDRSSDDIDSYKMYINMEGVCLQNIPSSSETYNEVLGHMVRFLPHNHHMCHVSDEIEKCDNTTSAQCMWNATDCFLQCGRCIMEDTASHTSSHNIDKHARGTWRSLGSTQDHDLIVNKNSISSKSLIDTFGIINKERDGDKEESFLYNAMVITKDKKRCMPQPACVFLGTEALGLLNFQVLPAVRSSKSLELLPCSTIKLRQLQSAGISTPPLPLTYLKYDKLECAKEGCEPCKLKATAKYPTMALDGGCRLLVHNCSGSCRMFNISLDSETCGNNTTTDAGIPTQHACVSSFMLHKSVPVRLTRSIETGKHHCWIFMSGRLFIISPERCNRQQIYESLDLISAQKDLDPVLALQERESQESHSSGEQGPGQPRNTGDLTIDISYCLFFFVFPIFKFIELS